VWERAAMRPLTLENKDLKQMASVKELKATARPAGGKGAARAERRAGRVPGVIYGNNQPPPHHFGRRCRAASADLGGAVSHQRFTTSISRATSTA